MKKLLYTSIFLFAILSCKQERNEKAHDVATYNTFENIDETLNILFSNGELKGELITIQSKYCICRLINDTLKLECSTGIDYVGGIFELSIINDSIYLNASKWSCTYTDHYESIRSKVNLNPKNYKINDSIFCRIQAELIHTDTLLNYYDTLQISGTLKLKIRGQDYSFEKNWQEERIRDFYKIANGKPDTVTFLSLYSLGLDSLPDEIMLFSNLKYLDLSDNNIPIEQFTKISGLKMIEDLSIRGNNLNQLPIAVLKLSNLKRLDIFANNISEFPKRFSTLKLKELHMEYNDFEEFPEVLKSMSSLVALYMTGNNIDDYEAEIKKMSHIKDYN